MEIKKQDRLKAARFSKLEINCEIKYHTVPDIQKIPNPFSEY